MLRGPHEILFVGPQPAGRMFVTPALNPGMLSWVMGTRVTCDDHVEPAQARVGALSTLQ